MPAVAAAVERKVAKGALLFGCCQGQALVGDVRLQVFKDKMVGVVV